MRYAIMGTRVCAHVYTHTRTHARAYKATGVGIVLIGKICEHFFHRLSLSYCIGGATVGGGCYLSLRRGVDVLIAHSVHLNRYQITWYHHRKPHFAELGDSSIRNIRGRRYIVRGVGVIT